MSIFSEARKFFEKGDYTKALELYEEAGKSFGKEVVSYHVQRCRELLGDSYGLDKITQILLSNSDSDKKTSDELLAFYNELTKQKSEDAQVKTVKPIPAAWPSDLSLAPLPESTNDFEWYGAKKNHNRYKDEDYGLSIIIPTFNRAKLLDVTLACLVNQKTNFNFEVIVADDGSKEDLIPTIKNFESRLQIKYVRQPDYGYQLCAIRNLGLRAAKYKFVSILDCDMAPDVTWVESYLTELKKNDNVALIGPRKYVDTSHLSSEDILNNPTLVGSLPEVLTTETLGRSNTGEKSIDWRLTHFEKTDSLRLCDSPFRYFSGGNVAFAKKWLDKAGWFDEEFTHWGGEDNEFGYRLYRAGCFFKSVDGALAYHQEPPGAENETDRAAGKEVTIKIVHQKVPYFYRKLEPIENAVIKRVPLVSIYVPAYNCEDSIERCVNSALNQTVTDLEVCICDDGSTDGTLNLIQEKYGKNPRVRFVTQSNGGIGKASNTAVNLCRGYYIGQLDSDDYLEPDAVELCLTEFFKNRQLACVYTTNRNVNPDGSLIQNGYNWPEYSREMLTTAMICHHFRMFTMRAWNLAGGFDEKILNAVDYDMYLKLSEVGPFKHVNKISYNRVLHGENTSIKKLKEQKENHFKVVNSSLFRQGIVSLEYKAADNDDSSRKYTFIRKEK
ncbi:glycosyltransferase [Alteromonas sp. CyTr2]|uniref:glycosyltransferase n=1 Tax=Alteromonas sp. CyTr2 TaxID=2935039 RepID=UPI00248E377B|nr:glycosyltransferase [Alteromonas sp. CyTr2]